jgi:chemotaxis protein histidine kinase CheA
MEVIMNETLQKENEEQQNDNEFVVELDENNDKPVTEDKKEVSEEKEQVVAQEDEKDEHDSYSEKVQKRIDQLTAKRKAAEDDMNNAINYAKQIKEENETLQKQLQTYTQGYTNEFDTRVTSQEAQVKQLLKEAYDAQDAEKIAEATAALSQVNIEKERLRVLKQQREQEQTTKKNEGQSNQVQEQKVNQANLQDNPKALAWIEKNPWYGKDPVMSTALMQIDKEVLDLGYNPTTDEYFEKIDQRMLEYFPNKFQGNNKVSQTVAPVNGKANVKSGRKQRVVLSESERRTADRLGVPYEKYAQQKIKLQKGA